MLYLRRHFGLLVGILVLGLAARLTASIPGLHCHDHEVGPGHLDCALCLAAALTVLFLPVLLVVFVDRGRTWTLPHLDSAVLRPVFLSSQTARGPPSR